MEPEYNFTGQKGVRGKYYRAYCKGHQVKIERDDGTVTVQYFKLEDGGGDAGARRAKIFSRFRSGE